MSCLFPAVFPALFPALFLVLPPALFLASFPECDSLVHSWQPRHFPAGRLHRSAQDEATQFGWLPSWHHSKHVGSAAAACSGT